jgi:hypothetical protein
MSMERYFPSFNTGKGTWDPETRVSELIADDFFASQPLEE